MLDHPQNGQTAPQFDSAAQEPNPASAAASPNGAADQAAADANTEAPLTMAQVRQLLAEQDARHTRDLRNVQSLVDKAKGWIGKRFNELQEANKRALELAKASGMTPEQLAGYERALQQDALTKAMGPEQAAGQMQDPQQQQRQPQPLDAAAIEQINRRGDQIMAQYGLGEGDPELAHVIVDRTPQEYLISLEVAGRMRQKRAGQQPAGGSEQPAGEQPNPARVPGLRPGGGKAKEDLTKLTSRELMSRAADKIIGSS